ncbi:ankyrin repeat domain-containing protein [Wolbachia endosymbiont of Ctenocephalides felis wCfeT]|uniref:ankyrin repeat domain-containing protein n=1 Tax=Wolbachia endosymbiont of Ctenocephalides felis wCfeT TaxID=2732593 RepID=UPI00144802B0|nr:ankyrin repeat domain-containing protein [Wolbachia endosymbiont of Ctenocephalides felis wCfeT]
MDNRYEHKYPLHYCAIRGDIAKVGKLLFNGANINKTDDAGLTVLHYVAAGYTLNYLLILDFLLQCKASVNKQDRLGNTPLHVATGQDDMSIINSLLAYRANPLLKNYEGKTPADFANGSAKRLLESAKKQEATNQLFAYASVPSITKKDIEVQLSNGADINATAKDYTKKYHGYNILTFFITLLSKNNYKKNTIKQKLLSIRNIVMCGADPGRQDDYGNSALSIIAALPEGQIKKGLSSAMINTVDERRKKAKRKLKLEWLEASAKKMRTEQTETNIEIEEGKLGTPLYI